MRKVFLFLFLLCCIANTFADEKKIPDKQIDSPNHLPEVTIDSYKDELLAFQKLQRDNEKLKLEEQNLTLKKKLYSSGLEDINKTKIVCIYSIKGGARDFAAQIYNIYDGMKVVTQGSHIMSHYEVIKITPTMIRLRDVHSQQNTKEIELSLVSLGANYGY